MKHGMTLAILVLLVVVFFIYMIYMPGNSYSAEIPQQGVAELEMADRLRGHVSMLCRYPAGRNYLEKQGLEAARNYIIDQFRSAGYQAILQKYQMGDDVFANVEAELTGTASPDEIVVIGAHYDAVVGAPGANDNASGVAALLELAGLFKGRKFPRTVRFVAFVNEEPPHFMSAKMGSYIYAKSAATGNENIIAMISLETIGYYSDASGSQHYPPILNFFYPDKGNFIAFVGNLRSRPLVTRIIRLFREHAAFPSEGIAAPSFIPGVSWSDHWSFWKQGYPAVMVTDTAPFRYPYYHTPEDTPDKVDYGKMVYVVKGMQQVLEGLLTGN